MSLLTCISQLFEIKILLGILISQCKSKFVVRFQQFSLLFTEKSHYNTNIQFKPTI